MSWLSKASGLDKKKDLLKRINTLLRLVFSNEVGKVKSDFYAACFGKGLTPEQAQKAWDALMGIAKADL